MSEYSDEHLNFFRICDITANTITGGLRSVFKREWDKNFQSIFGKWNDTPQNGKDFVKQETTASKNRNAKLLTMMINGQTEEWDCTKLCFGILYSNSIGATVNATTKTHVNDLREFRNEVFAHISKGAITDTDFKSFIARVEAAFVGLNIDINSIRAIAHQKGLPTAERRLLMNQLMHEQEEVRALQEKSSALEEELKSKSSKPKTFLSNLPTKPSHVIQERHSEVSMIMKHMEELKINSDGEISTVYLSGNPGCGKSQIARMVGEGFYKQVSPDDLAFVATLNAETLETLFNSYDNLSRALRCTDYAVGRITTSNDKIEEKLKQFQRLVTPKMREFSSWLLIIDNVVDLEAVRQFWPTSGSKEYGNGQILVTTQDSSTIPDNASHSRCMCLRRGMDPEDAVSLLTKTSNMTNQENVRKVAKALDYQPLALACAGWYVSNVRSRGCSNFNWERYLSKLERGKEETMGEIKKKCESGYTRSMPVAVRLAVERAVGNEEVFLHTFQFLSICAPATIPLKVVVDFVVKRMPDFDDEDIVLKLMESSLVQISCNADGKQTLWLHQVVYRVIRSNGKVAVPPGKELEVISAALGPVQSLTEEESFNSKIFAEHLSAFLSYVISFSHVCLNFYSELTKATKFISCASMCLKHGKLKTVEQCMETVRKFMEDTENIIVDEKISSLLLYFCGRVLAELSKFKNAIEYYEMSLVIRRRIFGTKSKDVADCLLQLGRASYNFSRSVKATEYYNEALTIFRKIHGEKHGNVADCLIGLGNLENNTVEAIPYYQEALSISKEIFGERNQTVARCLHNIGVTCTFLRRYEDAKKFLDDALDILYDIYGEKHEQVAICLCNTGRVHLFCFRYDKARNLFDKALQIRHEIGNQLRVGRNLHFLGHLSQEEGKISTAVDYYQQALDTFRRYEFPEDHLYVRDAVSALQEIRKQTQTTSKRDRQMISKKRKAS